MAALNAGNLSELSRSIAVPAYDRESSERRIVHLGVGGFHRAHLAEYVDALRSGGDLEWGLVGVGVLPQDRRMDEVLAEQDNLYTLVTVDPRGAEEARVIGSLSRYVFAPREPERAVAAMADPATRIVSLTITEGGYDVDDRTGEFAPSTPGVLADLEALAAGGAGGVAPESALGLLVASLDRRRRDGAGGLTVMSCDNIQRNGDVARAAVLGFAARVDEGLAEWIAENASFPHSMVDRITPATTDAVREDLRAGWGVEDRWPVRAESFKQWVLEEDFIAGRPAFERVGVQLVDDVGPYEKMKLRLLNASHQVMSHASLLHGYASVHETCSDPRFAALLAGYMRHEAAPTLDPVPGVDVESYCETLLSRFSSAAVKDTLARQVVDASERIPKFLLPVVRDALARGVEVRRSAFTVAAWCQRLLLHAADPDAGPLEDRNAESLLRAARREEETPGAFLDELEMFAEVREHGGFRRPFAEARRIIADRGVIAALHDLETSHS